jgi:DNA polymerase
MSEDKNAYAALAWQVEAGADEAILNEARKRFLKPEPAAKPAPGISTATTAAKTTATGSKRSASVPLHMEAPDEAAKSAAALAAACNTLDELRDAMAGFDGCALKNTAMNLVFGDGNPGSGLMFVGEAPGADEDREGKPFVGVSGQMLDRMIGAINRDRTSAYITNMIPWRPPGNRNPDPSELMVCLPFIRRHIELVAPKVLVLTGGVAAKTMLKTKVGITRLRGKWHTYDTEAGPIPALAMYHPAYLLRQPAQKRLAWQDLLRLEEKLTELG